MLGIAARDHHRRAALGELMGDSDTDSSAAAGHDCHFAFNAENVFQVFHLSVRLRCRRTSTIALKARGPTFFTFRAVPLSPHHHYRTEGVRANTEGALVYEPVPPKTGANPMRQGHGQMALLMTVAGVASRRWCGDNGAARKGEKHGKVKR
jgi:hypothetical protein